MWKRQEIQTVLHEKESLIILNIERGDNVVELDQFKALLNTYEEPLAEMRDSL